MTRDRSGMYAFFAYVTYKRKSKLRKVVFDFSNDGNGSERRKNIGNAVTFAKIRED